MEKEYSVYAGKFPCPKCKGTRTGSNTIATSEYWHEFYCHDCKREFKKKAENVSNCLQGWRKAFG